MKSVRESLPVFPICIAIEGFICKIELQQISRLFAYAQHWERPWQIVSGTDLADYVLVVANNTEDLSSLLCRGSRFTADHLIAYSGQPFAEARWHLRRKENTRPPSALEFTILLKEIGKNINSSRVVRKSLIAPSNKDFDWRKKLKIVFYIISHNSLIIRWVSIPFRIENQNF